MMNRTSIITIAGVMLLVLGCTGTSKQGASDRKAANTHDERYFRFMCYNVENLFDIYDDSLKNDDEFLPDKAKYWNYNRYQTKLNQIYQVMVAIGEWELPDAVGICEIENRFVIEQLIEKTPLYKADYKIIHYESPDPRGIDVAFLYRKSKFTPITNYPIKITFPESNSGGTRDILYIKGVTRSDDTIHFFINHWPSRWGGQMETEEKRMYCAKQVRNITDSIMKSSPGSNIVIAGDLNDHPTDKSLTESLRAENQYTEISDKKLYNLSYYLQETLHKGSHKHEGHWGVLDQIVVSGALLDKSSGLYTSVEDAHIFEGDFLLENDMKNTGKKPYRTYAGYKYIGGYSDHLPVYIDIFRAQK
ncbi:MAG TPA: endonuclease [Bacteroidales bacterium]|nr:endonuclease [Bacteroidales bacterium]